jgi:hypothetical protein
MGGVYNSIFPKYFKESKMDKLKLQKEVHSVVLSLLRQGFSLHSVIHALIVESEQLSDSAAVVQAINDFNQQP